MININSIPIVFISGPFRGKNGWEIEKNVRRAEELAFQVWRTGAACICPHLNTRYWDKTLPDEIFLDGDLVILSKCDAILHTPDWQFSVGAVAEHKFAIENEIEILYSIEGLEKYLEKVKNEKNK